jgi:hypothetical protein
MAITLAVWELAKPYVGEKLLAPYDEFKESIRNDLWERKMPVYTSTQNIKFSPKVNKDTHQLLMITEKCNSQYQYPLSWEGPELAARKRGFNVVMAKMMLDFDRSTVEQGNIYIKGKGKGRFQYLLGISKKGRDIFFHVFDEKMQCYIETRGRTHFHDYFRTGKKWVVLGIEWKFNGVKYLAREEGEKDFVVYPFNPPPELKDEILSDSRHIYFYGLSEFCIRTDLEVRDSKFKSIIGVVDYIKVRSAYLHWFEPLKRLLGR